MDEAALGAFNVLKRKRVWYATEFEGIRLIEGCCVESNNAVPAALDWDGLAGDDGIAGCLRPEVWECRRYSFMPIAVPERKGIVVMGRLREIEGARCCIVTVSCRE